MSAGTRIVVTDGEQNKLGVPAASPSSSNSAITSPREDEATTSTRNSGAPLVILSHPTALDSPLPEGGGNSNHAPPHNNSSSSYGLPTHLRQQLAGKSPNDSIRSTGSSSATSVLSSTTSAARFRASPIIDHLLYLGDAGDARALDEMRQRGIRRILDVAKECPPHPDLILEMERRRRKEQQEEGNNAGTVQQSASSPLTSSSEEKDLGNRSQEVGESETLPSSSSSSSSFLPPIDVLFMELDDDSDEHIANRFPEGLEYIREGVERKEPILVHCRHGVSRSATFVLAYLMQYGASAIPVTPAGPSTPLVPATTSTTTTTTTSVAPIGQITSSQPPPMAAMTYEQALKHCKLRRPIVSPNMGFSVILQGWFRKLNGSADSFDSYRSNPASPPRSIYGGGGSDFVTSQDGSTIGFALPTPGPIDPTAKSPSKHPSPLPQGVTGGVNPALLSSPPTTGLVTVGAAGGGINPTNDFINSQQGEGGEGEDAPSTEWGFGGFMKNTHDICSGEWGNDSGESGKSSGSGSNSGK